MDKKNIYCTKCGAKNEADSNYCIKCGAKFKQETEEKSFIDNTTQKINQWTGENKSVKLDISSMFSGVFEHHSKQEAEKIFIVGTDKTTPNISEVSDAPVKPWLFSRVLSFFALIIAILIIILLMFGNDYMYSGLLFISSCAVPFSLLIFFFEINAFKNISIYEISKIFLLGGTLSLLATMFLYAIIGNSNLSVIEAVLIGLIEESGKLLIAAYFIDKMNLSHIFNGMLIGAAVGAGFATFENAGYAQDYGINVLIIRSLGSLGSHTLWCAILGAALIIVKRDKKFDFSMFFDKRFINFFGLVVALHALWDMNLPFTNIKLIFLIISAWITILVLINAGLREIKEIHKITKNVGEI